MKHKYFHYFIISISIAASCAVKPTANPDKLNIAITEVNVIPMDKDQVIPNCTVLISNGLITAIQNQNSQVPKGYEIIKSTGKYLIPGLCDMHIHLRSMDEFNSFLRHGITTVLHMSGPMQSAPDLFDYRERIKNGTLIAPNLYFTSKCVEGERMNFPGVSESITNKEQADKFIDDALRKKCDFIKMYETIDSALYFYFMTRAGEKNISVIGHTPRNVDPTRMLMAGQKMIAHGEEFFFDFFDCRECGLNKKPDESRIPTLISILKSQGISVTPNLSFIKATKLALENFDSFENDLEFKYLPPEMIQVWKNNNPNRRQDIEKFKEREAVKYAFIQKLSKALNDAGVPLLAGTDCCLPGLFPGKSLLFELSELGNIGLSNYDCLATATCNPGRFIYNLATTGKGEKFGQIKEGFRADLVLLNENPLTNLKNLTSISAVIARGKYYDVNYLEARRNVYDLKLN